MGRPVQLGITMGDPAGIGPEIVAKALRDMSASERRSVRVLGPADSLARAAALVGFDAAGLAQLDVTDVAADAPVEDGVVAPAAGDVAYRTVAEAVRQAVAGEIAVMVTAPLNKAALHAAGHRYDGHTGLLAALTGSGSGYMLLASERLSTIHVSTHVSLAEAARRATIERVLGTIRAGDAHLRLLGTSHPRIAVAGLNPHCGEGGIFGTEELETIGPAVDRARGEGLDVAGPIPGDTVFRQAYNGAYDLVVAQYHDQGHIPVKLVAFETTVNVTVGLPVRRTSVDHGTAFDIAWRGVADDTNLRAAIAYARRMASA